MNSWLRAQGRRNNLVREEAEADPVEPEAPPPVEGSTPPPDPKTSMNQLIRAATGRTDNRRGGTE